MLKTGWKFGFDATAGAALEVAAIVAPGGDDDGSARQLGFAHEPEIVVGAGAYLVTFDLPPPSTRVEKVIPDDRFKQ